ncbi:tripartite motif-containing protein 2-like isoform X1 [Dysidea avara]|uniref:tripartite motif-containing protein 2-like isoform X1 n=2 Tax=Dysidea avara TaxID=196820 RepID=UPI003322D4BC
MGRVSGTSFKDDILQTALYLLYIYSFDIPFRFAGHAMDANHYQATVPIYLRCSICHRLYKDPKCLPCSHSYCEGCLVKLEEQKGGSKITAQAKPRTRIGNTVKNKHPLSVQIPQYTKPSKVVNGGRKMSHPRDIAFGKDGVWAVVGHTNHSNYCVYIFDSQDKLTNKFGSDGKTNGQLCNPQGITFDSNNHLYVADNGNQRVQKFDINGDYLLQFGKSDSSQIFSPFGITVYNDKVFVADHYHSHISVFLCNGQFSNTFGSGHLKLPHDVAVTNNNQILVANWDHHCISIFTLDGNYVNKIGTHACGSDRGQLNYPTSLSVNLNGFVFVAEYGNHRVSIFDKDGIFIHCFGSSGSSAGQFSNPCGIACSPNGGVYVCDYDNKRIQIFSDH